MKDLIEALTIFMKYKNIYAPTHCNHDVLMIAEISKEEVSEADQVLLGDLGFHWSENEGGAWISYRFGSA